MIKYALFLALLVGELLPNIANTQTLKFLPDSIFIARHNCLEMDTSLTIHLTNLGDAPIEMESVSSTGVGWEITSYPVGWQWRYKLQPHDIVAFTLRFKSHFNPHGSAVVYATSTDHSMKDSLAITIVRKGPILTGQGPSTASVFIGDITSIDYTLHNIGDEPLTIDSIYSVQSYSGVAPGAIIAPDSSLVLSLWYQTAIRGIVQCTLVVWSGCTKWEKIVSITARPNGAHWVSTSFDTTLTGCPTGTATSYDFTIANSREFSVVIDSITLSQGDERWTVIDNAVPGTEIKPGDTVTVTLIRQINANTHTQVILHQSTLPGDVLSVSITNITTRIGFTIPSDTSVVEMTNGDPVTLTYDIRNMGGGEAKLTAVEEDSPYWEVAEFDSTTKLISLNRAWVRMRFLGTGDYGSYPVTMRVHSTPCNTVLTKTLIASYHPLSIPTPKAETLAVYPQPASSLLTIDYEGPFSYTLIDVLGNPILEGSSITSRVQLNVERLPRGSYFLQVHAEGHVLSRNVMLQ